MVLGAMTHLALRVSDRSRSEAFYERVLGLLGYRRTAQTEQFTTWWSPRAGAITISSLPTPSDSSTYVGPGLHHLAFTADSREQVDAFHRHLQTLGIPVVKTPSSGLLSEPVSSNGPQSSVDGATYLPDSIPVSDKALGSCYAVLFKDPDGLCLELVYMALESVI